MYSSKYTNNESNKNILIYNNEKTNSNNEVYNDMDKTNYHNNEILITFNANNDMNNVAGSSSNNLKTNININENDLSNLNNPYYNKENKNRPSTAIYSTSSKLSLKNHIERIKSIIHFLKQLGGKKSKNTFNSESNNPKHNKSSNSNFNSTNNFGKLEESKNNRSNPNLNKTKSSFGPFLNIDYEAVYKVPEIKNEKVKKMLKDADGYGPYYSHCFSCNKKNLNFYDKLNSDIAIRMLSTIKDKKKSKLKKN